MPVPQPTSCIFGGQDLDVLYITTSRQNMTPEQLGTTRCRAACSPCDPACAVCPSRFSQGRKRTSSESRSHASASIGAA